MKLILFWYLDRRIRVIETLIIVNFLSPGNSQNFELVLLNTVVSSFFDILSVSWRNCVVNEPLFFQQLLC